MLAFINFNFTFNALFTYLFFCLYKLIIYINILSFAVTWEWCLCQQPSLHDYLRLGNTGSDTFVRQHLTTVNVNFVFNDDIFPEYGCAFHANPLTDGRTPTDDATVQPSMTFYRGTIQNCRTFYANAYTEKKYFI